MTGYRHSNPAPCLSLKSSLTLHLITLHAQLRKASGPNAFTLRLPVPSQLNIPEWRSRLATYPDTQLCDFLKFGWPVGYSNDVTPISSTQNHGSALSLPEVIDAYTAHECELSATCGFLVQPTLTRSYDLPPSDHLQSNGKTTCGSRSQFPTGIFGLLPVDTYLGEEFKLRFTWGRRPARHHSS